DKHGSISLFDQTCSRPLREPPPLPRSSTTMSARWTIALKAIVPKDSVPRRDGCSCAQGRLDCDLLSQCTQSCSPHHNRMLRYPRTASGGWNARYHTYRRRRRIFPDGIGPSSPEGRVRGNELLIRAATARSVAGRERTGMHSPRCQDTRVERSGAADTA